MHFNSFVRKEKSMKKIANIINYFNNMIFNILQNENGIGFLNKVSSFFNNNNYGQLTGNKHHH